MMQRGKKKLSFSSRSVRFMVKTDGFFVFAALS